MQDMQKQYFQNVFSFFSKFGIVYLIDFLTFFGKNLVNARNLNNHCLDFHKV